MRVLKEEPGWQALVRLHQHPSCRDITLLRGCLIAGLPQICTEEVEHYYKSMGWSLFRENIAINTINYPHVHVLRL